MFLSNLHFFNGHLFAVVGSMIRTWLTALLFEDTVGIRKPNRVRVSDSTCVRDSDLYGFRMVGPFYYIHICIYI
jgi:hypothetical protein